MSYKILEHTADVKIEVTEKDLEHCFKDSAKALRDIIGQDVKDKIKAIQEVEIEVGGKDLESLFYNFLEEFLFLLDAENFLVYKVDKIEFSENNKRLSAKIAGDNANRHKFTNRVKSVVYEDVKITKDKDKIVIKFILMLK